MEHAEELGSLSSEFQTGKMDFTEAEEMGLSIYSESIEWQMKIKKKKKLEERNMKDISNLHLQIYYREKIYGTKNEVFH